VGLAVGDPKPVTLAEGPAVPAVPFAPTGSAPLVHEADAVARQTSTPDSHLFAMVMFGLPLCISSDYT
jgi:hypothetical protein